MISYFAKITFIAQRIFTKVPLRHKQLFRPTKLLTALPLHTVCLINENVNIFPLQTCSLSIQGSAFKASWAALRCTLHSDAFISVCS
jgi:hypothetical protein